MLLRNRPKSGKRWMKRYVANAQRGSVSRQDPSRTGSIYRPFKRNVELKFDALKNAVVELVFTQDSFGLGPQSRTAFNFNPNQTRDEEGRWADTGGGAKGGLLASLKELGVKATHVEEVAKAWVSDKVATAVGKLPAPVQKAVTATYYAGKVGTQAAFTTWRVGQELAERVAKENGATDEQAHRLRGLVSALDVTALKPVQVILGASGVGASTLGIVSFVPPATAAYLAYSTARNPMATIRAARSMVRDTVVKGGRGLSTAFTKGMDLLDEAARLTGNAEQFELHEQELRTVERLHDVLSRQGYDDRFIALASAAIDELGDVWSGITLAEQLYNPNMLLNFNPNQPRDAEGQWTRGGSAASQVLARGLASGKEHSIVTDKTGKHLSEDIGDEESVDLGKHAGATVAGSGLTVFHNHPDNSDFSPGDVKAFAKYPGIDEIVAVTHSGKVQRMRVIGNRDDLYRAVNEYELKVKTTITDKFLALKNPTDAQREELQREKFRLLGMVSDEMAQRGFIIKVVEPTLNASWQFIPNAEKLKLFQVWLKAQLASLVKNATEEQLWKLYVEHAKDPTLNFNPNQPRDPEGQWTGPGGSSKQPHTVQHEVRPNDFHKFTVDIEGQQAGFLTVKVWPHAKEVVVKQIEVKEQHRRKGMAESMHEAAFKLASSMGYTYRSDAGLMRSPAAEGYWKKMVAQGKAKFEDGVYIRLSQQTINANWQFTPNAEKLKLFQAWLRNVLASLVKNATEEQLWKLYVEQGFKRGAGRAFDDVKGGKKATLSQEKMPWYEGGREQFLQSAFGQPVAVEKVQLLAQQTYDHLDGVTADMSNRMGRVLTDGLVTGKGPREVARTLAQTVELGKQRALVVARTELIRAHSEGQLVALKQLGVTELGVEVEWATGGKNVCPRCAAHNGKVYEIDKASGLIPHHPNCKCAWIPKVSSPTLNTLNSGVSTGDTFVPVLDRVTPELRAFSRLALNMNPNHDKLGRFAHGSTLGGAEGFEPKLTGHAGEGGRVYSTFDHGGKSYVVKLFHVETGMRGDKGNKSWDVSFGVYDQEPKGGIDVHKTGELGHSAVGVFRKVGKVIDAFISKYNPDRLHFTADKTEPGRVELYDKFAKLAAGRHGFEVKEHDQSTEKLYLLYRKKPTANSVYGYEHDFENVFVYNMAPNQPRDSHGRWTKFGGGGKGGHLAPKVAGLTKVKDLPGSTGPILAKDEHGTHYVVKKGGHKQDQLRNEELANDLYRAMGIKVPASSTQMTSDNGLIKVSKFIEGGQTLNDWSAGKSKAEVDAMHAKISKDFVADALLANWDVVGLSKDNILIKDGVPYRIDNGGAMKYRAQGGIKHSWHDSGQVLELQTLRDAVKNPSSASVFKGLTDADIQTQIKGVLSKKDAILQAASVDPETHGILKKRLEHLESLVKPVDPLAQLGKEVAAAKTDKEIAAVKAKFKQLQQVETVSPTTVPIPQTGHSPTTATHLHSADNVVTYIHANKGTTPFSPLYTDKLHYLNPEGVKNGVFYIPTFPKGEKSSLEKVAKLEAILPPGTVIKQKGVTAQQLAAKGVGTSEKVKTAAEKMKEGFASQLDAEAGQAKKVDTTVPSTSTPKPPKAKKLSPKLQKAANYIDTLPPGTSLGSVWQHKHGLGVKGSNGQLAVLKKLHEAGKVVMTEDGYGMHKYKTPGGGHTDIPAMPTPTVKVVKATVPLASVPSVEYHGHNFTPAANYHPSANEFTDQQPIVSGGKVKLQDGKSFVDQAVHDQWKGALTTGEQSAIASWKGSSGKIRKAMHKAAQGGGTFDDPSNTHGATAKHILTAMEKHPPMPGVFYRGISGDWAKSVAEAAKQMVGKPDAFILDEVAHGLSVNVGTAASFSGGTTFIRLKTKSTRPIWKQDGFEDEGEVLQPPMTKYRVVGVHENVTVNDSHMKYVLDLEEI